MENSNIFSGTGIDPSKYRKDRAGSASELMAGAPGNLQFKQFGIQSENKQLPRLFRSMPQDMTISEALYKVSSLEQYDEVSGDARGLGSIGARSARDAETGIVVHPFDRELALQMRMVNPYHATCIDQKAGFFWGQGFKNEDADRVLDDITEAGSEFFIQQVAKHFYSTGEPYIELIRNEQGNIDFLEVMMPTKLSKVIPTSDRHSYYYLYHPQTCYSGYGRSRKFNYQIGSKGETTGAVGFALPGRKEYLERLLLSQGGDAITGVRPDCIGEVAVFKAPTEMWDHYACPQWIGAHSYLELSRTVLQGAHDFFYNRGTPDSVTFFYGMKLSDTEQKKIQKYMSAGVGASVGKSACIFLPNTSQKTGKVQVEQYSTAMDGDNLSKMIQEFATGACAAHGMRPDLAGISMNRSLGGANELVQGLTLLEMSKMSHERSMFKKWMFKNIQPYLKGVPRRDRNFFELKPTVEVDESAIGQMNALARQDTQRLGPQASASEAGLKR